MIMNTIRSSIILTFFIMGTLFSSAVKADELTIKPKALSSPPAKVYSEIQSENLNLPQKLPSLKSGLDTELMPISVDAKKDDKKSSEDKKTDEDKKAEVIAPSATVAAGVSDGSEEDKIPVLASPKKVESSTSDSIYKILFMIFGVCISGIGIYIYLKKVSKQINTKSSLMQIKVLTQHHFGPKRSIAVIRVAGESILVGITDHNINVLKTLSLLDEELPEVTPKDFNRTLNEVKNETRSNETRNETANEMSSNDDDFEFAGIRDMVTSKIKNFRRI